MSRASLPSPARQPLATAQQVADYLGVPLQTVYQWRSRNAGPRARKVGRHIRFRWADVDAWLDAQADAA